MPILQNLNQVTVQVTNHPGPLIAPHKKNAGPNKNTPTASMCQTQKPSPSLKEKKNQSIKYKIE
jgi:hypothetical protein